jgi:hypothetical protein
MNFTRYLTGVGLFSALAAGAQTSTFTYQGQLTSGTSAVTGLYDLRFTLYDTFNGNTNLLDGPVTNAPVAVTNGLFVTAISFSNSVADFNGGARALAIGVRPYGNTGAYVALSPYQTITSTPYAIQSLNAMGLSEPLAATNISGAIPVSDLSSNVALLNTNQVFAGAVTATNFYGSGSGLTNIPTTSLAGILPDYLLSSNVAKLNTNAIFLTNVTAVQFTGSGHGLTNVPGAFFWETVNGTVSASSNEGYIVTNGETPVIITLPASPSPGDTFRVAGVGAGGWSITQNTGQQILAGNLAATTGLSWIQQTNSGVHDWTGLASSSDGTKLVAVSQGYAYVSSNSGVTWTNEGSFLDWSSVASSTDGSHLIATVGTTSGNIYLSANYGVTWTVQSTPPATTWLACASSASGSTVVAVSASGDLEYSVNGGVTWLEYTGGPSWTGVACSADGTKFVLCSTGGAGGYIWTSTNSGSTYTQQTGSGLQKWSAVASSADGTHLVATVTGNGGIYASANAGVNWFQVNPTVAVNWTAVASSADGSHLAAVYDTGTYTTPGYIYTSDDSGSSWLQRVSATNAAWTAVATSTDGSKLAAAAYNGYIYTSGQTETTTGTNGYLSGAYQSALELQYVGNGLFLPLSHEGTITAH